MRRRRLGEWPLAPEVAFNLRPPVPVIFPKVPVSPMRGLVYGKVLPV